MWMQIIRGLNADIRRIFLDGLKKDERISMIAQQYGFFHAGQLTHD